MNLATWIQLARVVPASNLAMGANFGRFGRVFNLNLATWLQLARAGGALEFAKKVVHTPRKRTPTHSTVN